MPAPIAELRPTERVTTLVGPLTDAQVAHAIRLDHELWDDAAFAAAQLLTTPGANRRLLIDRLDQALVLGDLDEGLPQITSLIEAAVAAHPTPERPVERPIPSEAGAGAADPLPDAAEEPEDDRPRYLLFEIDERRPGGMRVGWYYEILGKPGRAASEPVGPYPSDGAATCGAEEAGAVRGG